MAVRTRQQLDRPLRQRLVEEAHRLRGADTPAAAELGRALQDAARRRPDRAARRWFAAIERERQRLRADDTPLSGGRGTTSTVADVTRRASSPADHAALLFALTRRSRARRCLEMGTCVGISGAYLAAAMETNGGGTLRSIDSHEDRAEVARDTWARLGFDDAQVVVGTFARRLEAVLDEGPYDLVFVDGHHDGAATRDYVATIVARSRPGTLLCLDDIAWSPDMTAAWEAIRGEHEDGTTVDLGRLGLLVLGPRSAGRS